jgi:hypothetical protein
LLVLLRKPLFATANRRIPRTLSASFAKSEIIIDKINKTLYKIVGGKMKKEYLELLHKAYEKWGKNS